MDFEHGFVLYINCKLVDLSHAIIITICIIITCCSVIDYHHFNYAHRHFCSVNKSFPILYKRFAFDTKIVERVQIVKALEYQSI